VLKYAVRKNGVERIVEKGQETGVSNHKIGFDSELFRNAPCGENGIEAGIDPNRQD
jgi:hypothetical protein